MIKTIRPLNEHQKELMKLAEMAIKALQSSGVELAYDATDCCIRATNIENVDEHVILYDDECGDLKHFCYGDPKDFVDVTKDFLENSSSFSILPMDYDDFKEIKVYANFK